MASGLSSLLQDDQFTRQRSVRINRNIDNRFGKSRVYLWNFINRCCIWIKAMGASLWSGVKGVVAQPIQAVKKKGAKGFVTVRLFVNNE